MKVLNLKKPMITAHASEYNITSNKHFGIIPEGVSAIGLEGGVSIDGSKYSCSFSSSEEISSLLALRMTVIQ